MLKFGDFLKKDTNESVTLSNVIHNTNTTSKRNLNDDIKNFLNKHKTNKDSIITKMNSFRENQAIDIKIDSNIEISAQIKKYNKKTYCQLIQSNVKEISLLIKNDNINTNIIDPVSKNIISSDKKVYFQLFPDKNNTMTWFYFYNNTNFLTNTKEKPIFSKIYKIINIS